MTKDEASRTRTREQPHDGGGLGGVLMVVDSLGNGGAERQMALLCTALDGDWAPSVVGLTDGPYRQILEESDVRVTVLPRAVPWDVRPAYRVWRLIRAQRPLVIHAWGWMSVLSTWGASVFERIPLVNGSIRRGEVPQRRGLLMKRVCRIGDRVVANSHAGLRAFGVPEDRGHELG